jgi:hypothetical protein
MKKLIVGALAAIVIAAAAGSVLAGKASARGRTCTYVASNGTGIYITVDGTDNGAKSCNMFGKPAFRRVAKAYGPMHCRFATSGKDIRVTVRAKTAFAGAYICYGLSTRLVGWYPLSTDQ